MQTKMARTEKCTAIVLAAGQGKRMGTKVQKQYLEICGKPVLYYSLNVFQNSDIIDEIILVVGENQDEYCRKEIVEKYNINKVKKIITGGAERYHSVWNGLQEIKGDAFERGYVFIHDGARPFINDTILERVFAEVKQHKACVVGMPVKDTIKIGNAEGFADYTPNRAYVWQVQTPQVFLVELVKGSYKKMMDLGITNVTDDAMVVENMTGEQVKLVEGSYQNIKITTPEDLKIAEVFVKK